MKLIDSVNRANQIRRIIELISFPIRNLNVWTNGYRQTMSIAYTPQTDGGSPGGIALDSYHEFIIHCTKHRRNKQKGIAWPTDK